MTVDGPVIRTTFAPGFCVSMPANQFDAVHFRHRYICQYEVYLVNMFGEGS